jgi:hypothetical protein
MFKFDIYVLLTFATSTEVANMAGNKTIYDSAGTDITSTVLTDAIGIGDSRVILETGVADWEPTDALYYAVVQASEYFAVAYILSRYGKNENEINKEAMDYYQMALDICHSLANSATQSVYISSKAYKSYPINRTSGSIHRSLIGTDSTVNGE